MSLYGTVSTVALPEVLLWLGRSKASGRLEIWHGRRSTHIYLRQGRIEGCWADDPPMLLGQFLLFVGVIDHGTLQRALRDQASTSRRLDSVLLQDAGVSQRDLVDALHSKARETLLGLFDLADAGFRFVEDSTPDPRMIELDLSVDDLLALETRRAGNRLRIRERIRPDTRPRRATDVEPDRSDWPAPIRTVYEAIDGVRSFEHIVVHVHGTPFLVGHALCSLADAGHVSLDDAELERVSESNEGDDVGIESIRAFVMQALDSGNLAEAMRYVADALESRPTDESLRGLADDVDRLILSDLDRRGLTTDAIPLTCVDRGEIAAAELSPEESFLVGLAGGETTIEDLLAVAPLRRVEVLVAMQTLVDRGLVRLEGPQTDLASGGATGA